MHLAICLHRSLMGTNPDKTSNPLALKALKGRLSSQRTEMPAHPSSLFRLPTLCHHPHELLGETTLQRELNDSSATSAAAAKPSAST